MIDLSTKAGVLRFCELRRAEMVGCFRQRGRFESKTGHSFAGYAFMRHAVSDIDLTTAPEIKFTRGPKLPRITAMPLNLPPEEALPTEFTFNHRTRFFGETIRAFARAGKAEGVIMMGEAWVALRPKDEVDADRPYGWVEREPDKGEALYLQLEHSTVGWHYWRSWITRSGDLVELEPWVDLSTIGGVPGDKGRLLNLVDWRS